MKNKLEERSKQKKQKCRKQSNTNCAVGILDLFDKIIVSVCLCIRVICKAECCRIKLKFAGESVGNSSVCRVFCNDVFIILTVVLCVSCVFLFFSLYAFICGV